MAQQCAVCDKTKSRVWRRVKLRGKYNPTAKRDQKPNIQWVRIYEPFASRWGFLPNERVRACAKCIKSLSKVN